MGAAGFTGEVSGCEVLTVYMGWPDFGVSNPSSPPKEEPRRPAGEGITQLYMAVQIQLWCTGVVPKQYP